MQFYCSMLDTMAYIPPHYAVDDKKRNDLNRFFPNDTLKPELVVEAMTSIVESMSNVTFIDLTEFLKMKNNERPVYFELDSHLNPHGQKIVGEYLASKKLFYPIVLLNNFHQYHILLNLLKDHLMKQLCVFVVIRIL